MITWCSRGQKIVAYGLLLGIIVGSFLPPHDVALLHLPGPDKLHHATAYMLLTLAFVWPYRKRASLWWWRIIFPIWLLGALIEPLQPILSPGRECDLYDLAANTFGITLAVIVLLVWRKVAPHYFSIHSA